LLFALCRDFKIDFHDILNSRALFAVFKINAVDNKCSFKGDFTSCFGIGSRNRNRFGDSFYGEVSNNVVCAAIFLFNFG
jgi:hypothetical protein